MAQSKAFDSNAGSWPKFSGFQPLKPKCKEIRFLRLERYADNGELRYSMHHADFTLTPFAALSYSWGAPVADAALKYIVIDEQSVFIRPILHAFLVTLATHDQSVSLWIDAVCINQNDTSERNEQISMMGQIFGSAQKVFVWLGPGDDDTNYAFEHITTPNPKTSFDQRQFQPAVEKIFRASYWTRRWVIQEFALARELYISCGPYVTTWDRVMEMVDDKVLENDERALQVMGNFKGLKALSARQDLSLLDLMLRFQSSRCIDRRDKAFALRGIANDGSLLSPDYEESVADVYFRALSLLPTEGILPEMTGFRWPHRAASQILNCLLVNRIDFSESLTDKPSDRLLVVFEFVGEIRSVTQLPENKHFWICSKETKIFEVYPGPVLGSDNLKSGDLVYSLQSSPASPEGIFIAFRSDLSDPTIAGILLNDPRRRPNAKQLINHLSLIWRISSVGVLRCSRNSDARSQQGRILCHVSRSMFVLLWLLDRGEEHYLLESQQEPSGFHGNLADACHCCHGAVTIPDTGISKSEDSRDGFEIIPAFHSSATQEDIWGSSKNPLWLPVKKESARYISLQLWNPFKLSENQDEKLSFLRNGRNNLSFAAEAGLESWVKRIIQKNPSEVESSDFEDNTPFWWAVSSRNLNVVKAILEVSRESHNIEGAKGVTPLVRAIRGDQSQVVELMAATEKVELSSWRKMGRTPLSWAAQAGHTGPVKALLASHRVDPDAEDADGKTPLLWAAKLGNEAIVELLLATKRVKVNRKDLAGRTALSFAVETGNLRAVELLLGVDGIDPDIMDNQRRTPLRYAADGKHLKIFKRLLATNKVKLNVRYQYDSGEDG